VGITRDCPNFFGVPPIISGMGIAMKFKFCMHINRLNWNKSPLKVWGRVAVVMVLCQELPIIFRGPINRAHRMVIFATAQLSCSGLLSEIAIMAVAAT